MIPDAPKSLSVDDRLVAIEHELEHLAQHERARQLAARDAYNQSIGILIGAGVAFVMLRYLR